MLAGGAWSVMVILFTYNVMYLWELRRTNTYYMHMSITPKIPVAKKDNIDFDFLQYFIFQTERLRYGVLYMYIMWLSDSYTRTHKTLNYKYYTCVVIYLYNGTIITGIIYSSSPRFA